MSAKKSQKKAKNKVIVVIRDGWGHRNSKIDNAIASTQTPHTDILMNLYPNSLLCASGPCVGLPPKYQGNSEVGHLTIGSGRIIEESLPRISKSINNKSFFKIPELLKAIDNCKKKKSKLHIMGLLQTEGVHAHRDHLFALLDLCKKNKFSDVYIHLFTDGRDAPVTASLKQLRALKKHMKKTNIGTIASVSGRFYAMDRDKRWSRTKIAYECIVNGKTKVEFDLPEKTIKESHKSGQTDEFIIPRKLKGYEGISDKDSIIFYNFRTDRTRQLTQAIVEKEFKGWKRKSKKSSFVAMTQFYVPMKAKVAFKDHKLKNLLGNVVSRKGINQLRISETEKYAHVTFFFNGQVETPNKNEDRILIHSPKVKTYDLQPEMSVYKIANRLVKEIKKDKYELIVTNLVNGDMVGHTGKTPAIKKAVKAVDKALGDIVKAGLEKDYTLLIFADHGNAEDQRPAWRTSHTVNKVPCILASNSADLQKNKIKLNSGGLADISPTVLDLLSIKQPKEMTGKSLIIRK